MTDSTQKWNNYCIPLLVDCPGISKRVRWSKEIPQYRKVNSLKDFKIRKTNGYVPLNKQHLSKNYGVINGKPIIPSPGRSPSSYEMNGKASLDALSERYGKLSKKIHRPSSPCFVSAVSRVTGDSSQGHTGQESELNSEWVMYYSESTGWPYYYNRITNYSTYDMPEDLKIDHYASNQFSESDTWIECWDEEVEALFYYNQLTGEASWVNPAVNPT